jgi:modification methylase
MLPAIAATAITRYTRPGDLVIDPMCGIGTTLIEAVHLGRDAAGVEYEPRWAQLAAAGWAALVVTSPPYGRSVHGQVHAVPRAGGGGVRKYDNRYSDDPANLASRGLDDLLTGFTRILAGCAALLRPGGTVVTTARPWRQRGELVDLPGAILAAGTAAGLVPAERCVALLAGLRGQHLVPRPSFFQLDNVRKARARGEPWHLIVHEDVLVFTAPDFPAVRLNSGILGASSRVRRGDSPMVIRELRVTWGRWREAERGSKAHHGTSHRIRRPMGTCMCAQLPAAACRGVTRSARRS